MANLSTDDPPCQAVLCDLDGTLLDSNHLHAEAWRETFAHFGLPVTFEQALHQIGKGGDQLIPVFVPEKDLPRLQAPIAELRKALFEQKYFSRIEAFPGARDLLLKMKEAGLRIAIASSASKKDLTRMKEIAHISDLVEEETSSDDAGRSKPEPDIFQVALDRLGLPAEVALALGDTPWDVKAAQKAGLSTVAVTSGGWSAKDLQDAGAIQVYATVLELAHQFSSSVFMQSIR